MKVLIKKPKQKEQVIELADKIALYNSVSVNALPDFVTFDGQRNIGMLVQDDGCYSGLPRNFIFDNHIIYGNAVFVGLNKQGKAINLDESQTTFLSAYLNRNSLPN